MKSSASWAAWVAASPPECFGEPDEDALPDWKTIRESDHTARKEILCHCGDMIQPGERYHQTVATEDGKFVILRRCDGQCWK